MVWPIMASVILVSGLASVMLTLAFQPGAKPRLELPRAAKIRALA
jgi:hypothetical protein